MVRRVDDRRVISGIVHVIRNGLMWRDAPAVYGPPKTLYNRFVRWSRIGVFDRIFARLAAEGEVTDRPVTFTSSDASVVDVRTDGVVTGMAPGRQTYDAQHLPLHPAT